MRHHRVSRISSQRGRDERVLAIAAGLVFGGVVAVAGVHFLSPDRGVADETAEERRQSVPPLESFLTVRSEPGNLPDRPPSPTGSGGVVPPQREPGAEPPSAASMPPLPPTPIPPPTPSSAALPATPPMPEPVVPPPAVAAASPPPVSLLPREQSRTTVPPASPRVALTPAPSYGSATPAYVSAAPAPDAEATPIALAGARSALATAPVRVFVHHASYREEDRERAMRLARYLRAQGFTVADVRAVDAGIRSGSVRYFFPDDRAGSETVLRTLPGFYQAEPELGEPPRRPQDLTSYARKPNYGTIEVWLPSR